MASGERWAVGGLHLVVVGYLVASHICYLLQIYFEKFISIFIYFSCALGLMFWLFLALRNFWATVLFCICQKFGYMYLYIIFQGELCVAPTKSGSIKCWQLN